MIENLFHIFHSYISAIEEKGESWIEYQIYERIYVKPIVLFTKTGAWRNAEKKERFALLLVFQFIAWFFVQCVIMMERTPMCIPCISVSRDE